MAENAEYTKTQITRNPVYLKSLNRSKRAEKFKKFIGNKTEGQGFADKRKKKIQYEYLKTLKKERRKNGQRSTITYSSDEETRSPEKESKKPKDKEKFKNRAKVHRFTKVKEEAQKRKEIKRKKKEEALRKKHEREEALQKYNSAKKESFKKLCKKTHKGQPVMKNQIDYLLAKIEKQVNQT